MTEIAFHFNVENKSAYLCRLLRKAVAGGSRLAVIGPDFELQQLDAALWTFAGTEFIPHCGSDAENFVRIKSPVVLAHAMHLVPFADVLVNLGEMVPAGFEQFRRLIEVVTLDERDKKMARMRWKFYADGGFSLIRHDLQKAAV